MEEGKGLSGGRLTVPPKSHLVGGIRGIAPPGQLESPQPSWTEASLEEGAGQGRYLTCGEVRPGRQRDQPSIPGSMPSLPHLWALEGDSRNAHQLIAGCARDTWGRGLRGQRGLALGDPALNVDRPPGLWVSWGGQEGRTPERKRPRGAARGSCCWETNPRECLPRELVLALPSGMPPAWGSGPVSHPPAEPLP